MKFCELFESEEEKKLAVVYGGRFQPFHLGHFHAYQWLCKKFGKDSVWIATSDKTNFDSSKGDISPFTFKERKELMLSLYDMNTERIIKCKNPAFGPSEVFAEYKGFLPIYIAAVGKKDDGRYRDSDFFEKLPSKYKLPKQVIDLEHELIPVKDGKGYYTFVPSMGEGISGTKVREELLKTDSKSREKLFVKFFGKYDKIADDLITAKLKEVK